MKLRFCEGKVFRGGRYVCFRERFLLVHLLSNRWGGRQLYSFFSRQAFLWYITQFLVYSISCVHDFILFLYQYVYAT